MTLTTREGKVLSAESEAKIKAALQHCIDLLAEAGIDFIDVLGWTSEAAASAGTQDGARYRRTPIEYR
jgi:hypothetical protein